jgi:hypothetical protein
MKKSRAVLARDFFDYLSETLGLMTFPLTASIDNNPNVSRVLFSASFRVVGQYK